MRCAYLISGCGETQASGEGGEAEGKQDQETAGEMLGKWVTMGCIAVTKGVGGGVPCDMLGRVTAAAIDNSPDINTGSAWSCAKIGKNCDSIEDSKH